MIDLSSQGVMQYASLVAEERHLNEAHFLATLNCESGFAYDAVGDDGASLGVAQIDLKYHPEITYDEAMNPVWALNWMAEQWLMGRASEWSCWRKLFDTKQSVSRS